MAKNITTTTSSTNNTSSALKAANQYRPFPLRLLRLFLIFLILGLGISIVSVNVIRYLGIKHMVPTDLPTIQSCIFNDGNNVLASWIKPPSVITHTLNDTELLWRASFSSKIKKYPYKRVRKVAFMYLTRGPLPLAPIWERFFKGNEGFYSIYIHPLPGYQANFSSSSVFYNRQIPSQMVEWGKMSMCEAERRLLANALLDLGNEWFVLLSEACIPIRNFTITYRYLARTSHSFMGSYDEVGPYGRGRYDSRMEPDVTLQQWRKGSQWFEVNRELAIRIVEDTKYYQKFRDFCQPACYVDEHYFPTMLTIMAPQRLANRSLTWTDWSRGGPHPATFGKEDITEDFIRKILESYMCRYNNHSVTLCFLFARKFAPSAVEPLMELADRVFGY